MKKRTRTRTRTPEQIAATEARKARFRDLSKRLAGMSDAEKDKWMTEAGVVVTVEGRALSPRNTILCYFQRQDVTMVGGFRQWIKAGRAVKKGEHGLSILVPVGGGEDKETGETTDVRFIAGTVFDVSQTSEIETERAEDTSAGVLMAHGAVI